MAKTSKEIYKEAPREKQIWLYCLLFGLIINLLYTIFLPVYLLPLVTKFILFLFIIWVSFAILHLFVEISVDETYITLSRLMGLIKKRIRLTDIISYEIIAYNILDSSKYTYNKIDRILYYMSFASMRTIRDIISPIKGKAIKLRTQEGNYFIKTQNPEKIMEILRTRIGDKKELQGI